jgi:hypothetical protein
VTQLIKYRQSFEDLLIFNEHFLLNTPMIKRNNVIGWIIVTLFTLAPFAAADLYFQTGGGLIFGGAICLAFSLYRYPSSRRKRIRRNLRAYLTDYYKNDSGGSIGEHTVSLEGEFLIGTSTTSESRYDLKIVEIKENPPYTYYFVGAGKAFILSKDQVISGDHAAFDLEVREAIKAARAK